MKEFFAIILFSIFCHHIQAQNSIHYDKEKLLDAISELTVNYIVKLIEQEKTYLAS